MGFDRDVSICRTTKTNSNLTNIGTVQINYIIFSELLFEDMFKIPIFDLFSFLSERNKTEDFHFLFSTVNFSEFRVERSMKL